MTKIRLSSFSRPASVMRPECLGLVAFAVAQEGPDVRACCVRLDAAVLPGTG